MVFPARALSWCFRSTGIFPAVCISMVGLIKSTRSGLVLVCNQGVLVSCVLRELAEEN